MLLFLRYPGVQHPTRLASDRHDLPRQSRQARNCIANQAHRKPRHGQWQGKIRAIPGKSERDVVFLDLATFENVPLYRVRITAIRIGLDMLGRVRLVGDPRIRPVMGLPRDT